MNKKKPSKTIPAKTRKNARIKFENQNRSVGAQTIYNKIADIDSWAKRTAKGPTKVKITKQAAALRKSTEALLASNTSTPAQKEKELQSLKQRKKVSSG